MSLQNAAIATGATSVAVTGGSQITFSPDGQAVVNGIHLVVTADVDFRTRRNLTVKQKSPTLNTSTGEYSKDRKSLTYVVPKILENGKTVFNLIRIEREVHPESSAADAFELNMVGAQLVSDPDFDGFWATGTLS